MLYMLSEILTRGETSNRWGFLINGLHRKLDRLKDSDLLVQLMEEGKEKDYKSEEKVRGGIAVNC